MNSLPVPSNPAAAPPRDPRRQGSLSVRRLPPGPNPYPVFAASRPTAPAPTLAAAGEGPSGSSASSPEPSAVASPPSRPIHVLRLLPLYGPHLPGFGSHLPPPPPPPSPGFGPRSWRAAPAKCCRGERGGGGKFKWGAGAEFQGRGLVPASAQRKDSWLLQLLSHILLKSNLHGQLLCKSI
ncbi:hypothetical protein PVAP13_3KG449901 [Panicum virgatum]|uniref:Uncharacterized protein n=1 Tax=Panicum virgatum TaxID=38727 RepID=A0A8T0V625_PANVG|nr:hypothetical protein PVAP13_3KG449901 [Panicum virgatum]